MYVITLIVKMFVSVSTFLRERVPDALHEHHTIPYEVSLAQYRYGSNQTDRLVLTT